MGADLSLWNTQPSGAMNYAGPGVANLNGTSVVAFNDSGSGAGATPGAAGPGVQPTGFCKWLQVFGPDIAAMLCPAYQSPAAQQAGADYQGKPTGFVPPPGSPGADVTQAISGTVASIVANKSLWLLAGMILLFVIVVMVIRR